LVICDGWVVSTWLLGWDDKSQENAYASAVVSFVQIYQYLVYVNI
jgi:hypothetical protein